MFEDNRMDRDVQEVRWKTKVQDKRECEKD